MLRPSHAIIAVIILLAMSAATAARAYVASSGQYRLVADSISIGGGTASSGNYSIDTTIGGIGTGLASSSSYILHAGYQAMSGGTLRVTFPDGNIDLDSAVSLTAGGQSNASMDWLITSATGYTLSVRADSSSTALAFIGARGRRIPINDYAGAPDYDWLITSTQSGFGFSPEGEDIATEFKNDGSGCGAGVGTSGHCWDGFSTTTDRLIATRAIAGTDQAVTLKIRLEIGADAIEGVTEGEGVVFNGFGTAEIISTVVVL